MTTITYSNCPGCGSPNIGAKLSARDFTVSGEQFDIWECRQCSLRFTQNIPTQHEIGAYYKSENYISHTDTRAGFINSLYHLVRKKTLDDKKKMIEAVVENKQGTLLDIGAGTGAFAKHMENAGWKVTGLEPDEGTRNRAHELHALSLGNTTELFSLKPESYDAVTMWHVLEHVHALHEYLEQIEKLLKPSGAAFIAVPNYTSYDATVYGEHWAAYDVPRHLYHFSPGAMALVLKAHGLTTERMVPMWYDAFYVSMLSEKYKTGKSNYIGAFINGLQSNFSTVLNHKKCSSLIYIVKKLN